MKKSYFITSFVLAVVLSNCMVSNKLPKEKLVITSAELGHRLFFDQRLSVTSARSCSSCHDPAFAFSDGYRKSVGVYGDKVQRNAPALINVKDRSALTYSDPDLKDLEKQMLKPMFSKDPPELGITGNEVFILNRLKTDSIYSFWFRNVFPNQSDPINFDNIRRCMAAYMKGLVAQSSPYDDFVSGKNPSRMTVEAKKGWTLFFGDRLKCDQCHGGKNFDTPTNGKFYANTGLYFCPEFYPKEDWGLFNKTHDSLDIGKFRIPSLRNVAITAPYFHDGSANSLREVIQIYMRGGRKNEDATCNGDGAKNPLKDSRIHAFDLTEEEQNNLIHFLYSLTDTSYISNPYFMDPFHSAP